MGKLDSIFDKAMKAGREIEQRKAAIAIELEKAAQEVNAATAEMEKAAVDGNEAAYAKAKEKRNAAENRLEILQIRARKSTNNTDWIKECGPVLKELENDSTSELCKMCREFLSMYADIVTLIDSIDEYSQRYNRVQMYFRDHIIRSDEYRFKYMAEILPILHILDFKKKFAYQRSEIEKRIGK